MLYFSPRCYDIFYNHNLKIQSKSNEKDTINCCPQHTSHLNHCTKVNTTPKYQLTNKNIRIVQPRYRDRLKCKIPPRHELSSAKYFIPLYRRSLSTNYSR